MKPTVIRCAKAASFNPFGVLLFLCAFMLSSCLSDDYDECATGRTTVQLRIVADGINDLNASRATFDDENAAEGEFMNTLCVFIVDGSGKILTKLEPDLIDNFSEAEEGNLTEYTVSIDVDDSAAKIYAFSNWDNMDCSDWNTLISKGVGDNITSTDLNFAIDDPASKVDPSNGNYIPMSGQAAINLNGDLNASRNIEVTMDRLVGKVTIAIDRLESKDVTLDSLTFSGWADKVSLFPSDSQPDGVSFDKYYGIKFDDVTIDSINGNNSTSEDLCTFYVNETYRSGATSDDVSSEGYTVKLTTTSDEAFDEYDGAEFYATTARQDIPRNNIYPLTLTLDRYKMGLTVKAWTDGISVVPTVYFNDDRMTDGSYLIQLREETMQVTMTPKITDTNDNSTVSNVIWTWEYVGSDEEFVIKQDDDGMLTCTQFSAYIGWTWDFTLTAEWTTEGSPDVNHSRTYNIEILFSEGEFYIIPGYSIGAWIAPDTIERLGLTSSKAAGAKGQR